MEISDPRGMKMETGMLDHPIFINGMEIQIPEVRKKMVLATST
jgi:hypothetical protein